MAALTPITPLEPGGEMFQRVRSLPLFTLDTEITKRLSLGPEVHTPGRFLTPPEASGRKPRPLSEITEIFEHDEEESEFEDDESEFEEDSDEGLSFESNEGRRSQSTISTQDEVQTPRSLRRPPFLTIDTNKPVEGPRGPHLFRSSTASSEFSFDHALQLSPLSPVFTMRPISMMERAIGATPTTAITASPALLPPAGTGWLAESPRTWTAQQVALWMLDKGIESSIVEKFSFHDITGTVLLDLQFQDLRELGVQSFGKRHQLWSHICSLRDTKQSGSRSPVPTPFQDIDPKSSNENVTCGNTPVTPGGGEKSHRRRRKHRRNGDEPITPADSVSIVAIEQLIPKPHKCAKGQNCHKWRKQQRLLAKIREENGFPISPENGGHIFMAGDPGNASTAKNLVNGKKDSGSSSPRQQQHLQLPNAAAQAHSRPKSEAEPSIVGPSIVASSDVLGPGVEEPGEALDPEKLRQVEERDPQENVKNFLSLQHVEPPAVSNSPFEEPIFMSTPIEPTNPNPILPINNPLPPLPTPSLKPPSTQTPLAHLSALPRLEIPTQLPPRPASTAPRSSTALHNHPLPAQPTSANPFSPWSPFSPCRTATSPFANNPVYRFATPASEIDVPVTAIPLGPVSRETSQSVPPNMYYRDPHSRPSSHAENPGPAPAQASGPAPQPPRRRPSTSTTNGPLPPLAEGEVFDPRQSTLRRRGTVTSRRGSGGTSGRGSPNGSIGSSGSALGSRSSTPTPPTTVMDSGLAGEKSPVYDSRYPSVTHSGWMKKRRTKLLRHEWAEAHFRLRADKSTLTMHQNDLPDANVLDALNIDEYTVACSSLASGNKLSSKFRAMKVGDDVVSTAARDAAFSFQLVPTVAGADEPVNKVRRLVQGHKTHYFAVRSRDERIEWMRELMLAKALKAKGDGFEVVLNGNQV